MPTPDYPHEFRDHINALFSFLLATLNHTEYRVTFRFRPEPDSDDSNGECACTWMRILVNATYLWASVEVYPRCFEAWKEKEYAALGGSLLHEACHLLTHPIVETALFDAAPSQRAPFREIAERQTQRIANALMKLLPNDWYVPPPGQPGDSLR